MDKIVELERINFATIPAIKLRAKLAEGFTQVAIVSDPCPFSDQAFELFRNVMHRLVLLRHRAHPRGRLRTHVTRATAGTAGVGLQPRLAGSISIGDKMDFRLRPR